MGAASDVVLFGGLGGPRSSVTQRFAPLLFWRRDKKETNE